MQYSIMFSQISGTSCFGQYWQQEYKAYDKPMMRLVHTVLFMVVMVTTSGASSFVWFLTTVKKIGRMD